MAPITLSGLNNNSNSFLPLLLNLGLVQEKQGDRDAASDAAASQASQASRLKALKEANDDAEQRIKEWRRRRSSRRSAKRIVAVLGRRRSRAPALPSAVAKQEATSISSDASALHPAPDAVDEFVGGLVDCQRPAAQRRDQDEAASAPVKASGRSETPACTKSYRADASDDMRCPISLALMRDPVICAEGRIHTKGRASRSGSRRAA